MDRLSTADFNVAVCIDSPPGSSKSVTREQKTCARLWRLQKNPGELQKSHKMDLRVSNFGVVEGQRPNRPAHLLSSTLCRQSSPNLALPQVLREAHRNELPCRDER